MDKKQTKHKTHDNLLKELVEEDPSYAYLTDIGFTLQDYISTKITLLKSELDPASSKLETNFATCLFLVLSKRYDKNEKFIH